MGGNNSRQNKDQEPKKKLSLALTDPLQDPEGGLSTFVATATASEGGDSLSDTEIIFMVSGRVYGEPEITDENGVAIKSISLGPGSYIVTARINKTSYGSSGKPVNIKKPEKKVPSKIRISPSGDSGNYTLFIEVLDGSGNCIKNADIVIRDPKADKPEEQYIEAKTDNAGKFIHYLKFTDEPRLITVNASGIEKSEKLWN
jgi:hypothetical protein